VKRAALIVAGHAPAADATPSMAWKDIRQGIRREFRKKDGKGDLGMPGRKSATPPGWPILRVLLRKGGDATQSTLTVLTLSKRRLESMIDKSHETSSVGEVNNLLSAPLPDQRKNWRWCRASPIPQALYLRGNREQDRLFSHQCRRREPAANGGCSGQCAKKPRRALRRSQPNPGVEPARTGHRLRSAPTTARPLFKFLGNTWLGFFSGARSPSFNRAELIPPSPAMVLKSSRLELVNLPIHEVNKTFVVDSGRESKVYALGCLQKVRMLVVQEKLGQRNTRARGGHNQHPGVCGAKTARRPPHHAEGSEDDHPHPLEGFCFA